MTRYPKNVRKLRELILEEQGGVCADCEGRFLKAQFTLDHIIPKSRGGSGKRSNLQVLCRHCHQNKTFFDTQELHHDRVEGIVNADLLHMKRVVKHKKKRYPCGGEKCDKDVRSYRLYWSRTQKTFLCQKCWAAHSRTIKGMKIKICLSDVLDLIFKRGKSERSKWK